MLAPSRLILIYLAMLLAAAGLVGCQANSRTKLLVGTWVLEEFESLANRVGGREQNGLEQQDVQAEGQKMILVFQASGTWQSQTKINAIETQKKGSWKLISWDETSRKMTLETELDGQLSSREVELMDGDRIRLCPPNLSGLDMKLTFRRF